jgi:S-methylmethionine-dependent homocysteine/selenocysteine methylase
MPTPPPLWSAAALLERRGQGLLRLIAGEYIQAGAEILTTNTFRTHQRNLDAGNSPLDADDLNRRAVRMLREAIKEERAEGRVWVAGSITTLEDCYRPDLVPSDAECEDEHAAAAASLVQAGVDLLLLETFNTVRESAAALLPDAMGINCTSLAGMELALTDLEQAAPHMPRVAYGNIGRELESGAWDSSDCPPDQYAAHAARWHEAGARVIGGCCGTTPAHIKATAAALRG